MKKTLSDPSQWTEEKQLIAMLDLRLQQLFWISSLAVDGKVAKKALKENPPPSDLFQPDYIKHALEEKEKAEERQKRSELAEAVLKHSEEMKKALSAPRVKIGEMEGEDV